MPPLATRLNEPDPDVLMFTPPLPVPDEFISIAPFAVAFDAVINVPLVVVLPPVIVSKPVPDNICNAPVELFMRFPFMSNSLNRFICFWATDASRSMYLVNVPASITLNSYAPFSAAFVFVLTTVDIWEYVRSTLDELLAVWVIDATISFAIGTLPARRCLMHVEPLAELLFVAVICGVAVPVPAVFSTTKPVVVPQLMVKFVELFMVGTFEMGCPFMSMPVAPALFPLTSVCAKF